MAEKNFDDVIDPDENIDALAEAQGIAVQERVTILDLLNGRRVKVRYVPQSLAASLEYDDGSPIEVRSRKPKFNFKKWAKGEIPKMNALALKNVQIVNDLDLAGDLPKDGVRLSLIGAGEFRRLRNLCFPGALDDSSDSPDEDDVSDRASRKRDRSRQPLQVGPE